MNGVTTGEDSLTLNIRGNDLIFTLGDMENGQSEIVCSDADDKILELALSDADNQIYTVNDERFGEISIQPILYQDNAPCISVTIDGVAWNFVRQAEGGYYYLNGAGKMVKMEKINRVDWFRDDAMSLRGYIWNDSIPLIVKHIFIGAGANAFMFAYPQNDYMRQYIFGQNVFDVKAHCWYLQQCIETGVIGTLLLIGFLLWYFIQSVRIYRRVDLRQRISWVGFGLFSAVLVYLLTALVNDSNVCTAPVFWGILGLGMAVNRMLVQKENLFTEVVPQETSEDTSTSQQKTSTVETAADTFVQPKKNSTGKKQSRKQRKNRKK